MSDTAYDAPELRGLPRETLDAIERLRRFVFDDPPLREVGAPTDWFAQVKVRIAYRQPLAARHAAVMLVRERRWALTRE